MGIASRVGRFMAVADGGVSSPATNQKDKRRGLIFEPEIITCVAGAAITAGQVVRFRSTDSSGDTAVAGESYVLDVALVDLTLSGDETTGFGLRGVALEDAAAGAEVRIQLSGVCQASVAGTVAANLPLSHQADGVLDEAGSGEAVYAMCINARTGSGLTEVLFFPFPIGVTEADFSN